jgi:hypothetical protein
VRGAAGNRRPYRDTLTDPALYPAEELLELRLRRWDVETNIGSLKTTMGMDVLRGLEDPQAFYRHLRGTRTDCRKGLTSLQGK